MLLGEIITMDSSRLSRIYFIRAYEWTFYFSSSKNSVFTSFSRAKNTWKVMMPMKTAPAKVLIFSVVKSSVLSSDPINIKLSTKVLLNIFNIIILGFVKLKLWWKSTVFKRHPNKLLNSCYIHLSCVKTLRVFSRSSSLKRFLNCVRIMP